MHDDLVGLVAHGQEHVSVVVRALAGSIQDRRSGRVVFLSHCLLNENTRYAGGACRGGCVREIVDQCLALDLGIVQLPCPEEAVWGGVLKRRFLAGLELGPRARRLLLPLGLRLTRARYRRLARRVAAQVADYQRAGMTVAAIVAVDGSPSCGLATTIGPGCVDELAARPPGGRTAASQNAAVRRHARPGRGMFTEALQQELARRGLSAPWLAHDLLAELDGRPSGVTLAGAPRPALSSAARPLTARRRR